MPIPLLGFLEGDTVGLLVLAEEQETLQSLALRLEQAASLRVAPTLRPELVYRGHALDPALTVQEARLQPLDRFDVRERRAP